MKLQHYGLGGGGGSELVLPNQKGVAEVVPNLGLA